MKEFENLSVEKNDAFDCAGIRAQVFRLINLIKNITGEKKIIDENSKSDYSHKTSTLSYDENVIITMINIYHTEQ